VRRNLKPSEARQLDAADREKATEEIDRADHGCTAAGGVTFGDGLIALQEGEEGNETPDQEDNERTDDQEGHPDIGG